MKTLTGELLLRFFGAIFMLIGALAMLICPWSTMSTIFAAAERAKETGLADQVNRMTAASPKASVE